jgi:tetratricopeptide (TPR) repeat protein
LNAARKIGLRAYRRNHRKQIQKNIVSCMGAEIMFFRAKRIVRIALEYSKRISAILILIVAAYILYIEIFNSNAVYVNQISVPRGLADRGYSSSVVTQRLLDNVKVQYENATTTMRRKEFQLPIDMPDVSVTPVGLSLESLAAFVRSLLPDSWRNDVSGEITISGGGVVFILRRNGSKFCSAREPSFEAIDRMIEHCAQRVVAEVQPYIAALLAYRHDLDEANKLAEGIIGSRARTDENVLYAYNLKGWIAQDKGLPEEAAAAYREAQQINPRHPMPYNNLGVLWHSLGRDDDAIASYRAAIHVNSRFAAAHNNLGAIWQKQGKLTEAIMAYRAAIRLDPQYAAPHRNLGLLLKELADKEDGIRRAKRLSDACAAFSAGAKIVPRDPEYRVHMEAIEIAFSGSGNCPVR